LVHATDYTSIPKTDQEQARNAAKQAVAALLRLEGLDDLPEDDNEYDAFMDQLDRVIDRLGLYPMLREEQEGDEDS
jgi:hypothetical protein